MELTGKWQRCRKGYVRLQITGYSAERFLNLCSANQLEFWDLRPCRYGAVCCMTLPVFRKIRPLVRKAGVKVRILGRYGIPFFIYRNRRREGLLAGGLAFWALLYVLSLFVWNITFEGNYHYSRDTLLNYLDTLDVRYGMRKSLISCEDLEESIRSAFPEITWVSASVSGTRLMIRIKENEVLSAVPETDDSPCRLEAAKPGTITRMIVRQGRAAAAPGDTVEKGQLLVASELSVMNDSGEVVRTMYVHADADVYAETAYHYEEKIPGFRQVKADTGRRRRGFRVSFGPLRIEALAPLRKDRLWNYLSESRQLCLFGDFYLPVFWEKIVGEEYVPYEKSWTETELNALAQQIHGRYLENLMEKGVHITENNVKILKDGLSYVIEGNVTGEEEISEARPVESVPDTENSPETENLPKSEDSPKEGASPA